VEQLRAVAQEFLVMRKRSASRLATEPEPQRPRGDSPFDAPGATAPLSIPAPRG